MTLKQLENLKLGWGWNKGLKGFIHSGSFKKGHPFIGGEKGWFKKGKMGELQKGENHYNWKGGLPKCAVCKKELKDYRSAICEECFKGENAPNWQGGKSFEIYPKEFNNQLKKQIRKRDNYRCQQCFRHQDKLYDKNSKKYKLIIHHIDYDKKNNNSNNLISLCRSCHLQTNYSREDWTSYFKAKL